MSVHASYQGIPYEITEAQGGDWQWSFSPPVGSARSGRTVGDVEWAVTVARRAIDVWLLMNRGEQGRAA